MPLWPVHFRYMTGLTGALLPGVNARLHGSWDGSGNYFDAWSVRDRQRAAHANSQPKPALLFIAADQNLYRAFINVVRR